MRKLLLELELVLPEPGIATFRISREIASSSFLPIMLSGLAPLPEHYPGRGPIADEESRHAFRLRKPRSGRPLGDEVLSRIRPMPSRIRSVPSGADLNIEKDSLDRRYSCGENAATSADLAFGGPGRDILQRAARRKSPAASRGGLASARCWVIISEW